jgi:hypothetical protein
MELPQSQKTDPRFLVATQRRAQAPADFDPIDPFDDRFEPLQISSRTRG